MSDSCYSSLNLSKRHYNRVVKDVNNGVVRLNVPKAKSTERSHYDVPGCNGFPITMFGSTGPVRSLSFPVYSLRIALAHWECNGRLYGNKALPQSMEGLCTISQPLLLPLSRSRPRVFRKSLQSGSVHMYSSFWLRSSIDGVFRPGITYSFQQPLTMCKTAKLF